MNKNEIVLFETADNEVSLQVQMQDETVWLTQSHMVELFGRDILLLFYDSYSYTGKT